MVQALLDTFSRFEFDIVTWLVTIFLAISKHFFDLLALVQIFYCHVRWLIEVNCVEFTTFAWLCGKVTGFKYNMSILVFLAFIYE